MNRLVWASLGALLLMGQAECPTEPDPDMDQDGYPQSIDCDDQDASINPGATEIPDDGIDQDCDGIDETSDGIWTCNESWYGGLYCDCGCGIIDPQCADSTSDSCEWNNCPDGQYPAPDANWLCIEPTCGNGQLEGQEQCDDNNTTDGDGCSSTCTIEFACEDSFAMRVVASNLTSGNHQSYDPGHGQRILMGLSPDVVLMQEFNYGDDSTQDIQAFVDETFGPGFYFSRGPDNQIPNGVISRWPIVESGWWNDTLVSNREFAWARIDIPGSRDLWAVSVHFLTSSSGDRNNEANQLVDYIQANIPDEDLLVFGGDLNTSSENEAAINTLRQIGSFDHTPVDHNGNPDTNSGRNKTYDWVIPDPDLDVFHAPTVMTSATYPEGLVFDSRIYSPLSDVEPVLQGDSAASGMQHMAVVKDYVIEGCQ